MFNVVLFLLSPFLALAGVGNVASLPGSSAQPTPAAANYLTGGSCWSPDPTDTLTVTREMLDPVHAQYPNTQACYGTGEFNGQEGVLGGYTLVQRSLPLTRFKTDTEGGPYYGGCDITGSSIRYIGNLPDGRAIWWADSSHANGRLDGLVYIETGNSNKDRTFDVYAHDRIIEDPAASGHGHILECKIKGGVVPVVEENASLLPPQVVSFTNDPQYTNNGKRPYLDTAGYEANYAKFSGIALVTQVPGTIGPTIPPTAVLFPPAMNYIVKVQQIDEPLPKKAVSSGRIGTVRGTNDGKSYQYEVYFHAGEFYLRDKKDNSVYTYEASSDVPPSSVDRNASLQLGVLNFRLTNIYGPYTPTCKPAIYLYPQTKTDISVQVIPDGYLTDSIPSYGSDGWKVTAYPDGTIEQSGKQYPYLYYEANIKNLSVPKEGWLVKKEELPLFFDEKLAYLGLNTQESQDFKEYWIPKLTNKPYYFVTVVSQDELNRKETLLFSKNPDTLIRVRMIFEGLEKPVSVMPLVLPEVKKRDGFTAVDWGGGELGKNCKDGKIENIIVR